MEDLKPIWSDNYVVISATSSNEYVPYLSVYLESIKANADEKTNYDVVILEKSITEENKKILSEFFEDKPNFSLRFYNPEKLFENKNLTVTHSYLCAESYFRLGAPLIFKNYNRIIFTDIDLIFNENPKSLWEIDMNGAPLAAVLEPVWSYWINSNADISTKKVNIREYSKNILKLDNPHHYFNTGVMLMDIKRLNEQNIAEQCISKLSNNIIYLYQDQDILNEVLASQMSILPFKWNYEVIIDKNIFNISNKLFIDYCNVEKMKIIHWIGSQKPWINPKREFASIWWEYAKKTPYYDVIFKSNELGRKEIAEPKEKGIKVFVTYKNRHKIVETNLIKPIQTGRAIANEIFEEMIGDDTGDNISKENDKYCELTAQYWAWKNYDKIGNPDYIGFMHYRRLLNFQENNNIKYFEQYESFIDNAIKICFDYDIILPQKLPAYSPSYKINAKNLIHHWELEYNAEYLTHVIDLIKKEYPEMQSALSVVSTQAKAYWYNMFVMRKEIFFEYCDWLFPILEKCKNFISEARMLGFLAERLLNIFVEYKKSHRLNIKELPIFRPFASQYKLTNKNIIPVVLISSNLYVPQTATTITSIINNCSQRNNLLFYILSDNITKKKQYRLKKYINQEGADVEFIEITQEMLAKFANCGIPSHMTTTTFLKLLIPELLPAYDKILYVDSDIMVRKDITPLINEDISNYYFGMVEDVANTYHAKRLWKERASDYYNAGVIIFNSKLLRTVFYLEKIEKKLNENTKKYVLADQDLINDVFRGKIKTLSPTWNFHHSFHDKFVFYVPNDADEYKRIENDPAIIHYVGKEKVWYNINDKYLKDEYFKYWQQTPFYKKFRIDRYEDYVYKNLKFNYGKSVLFCKKSNNDKIILKFLDIKITLARKKLKNILSLPETIFSIKNKQFHKIFNILGIKIKIPKKNRKFLHLITEIEQQKKYINWLSTEHKRMMFSSIQKGKYINAYSLLEAFIKHVDEKILLNIIKIYFGIKPLKDINHQEILIYVAVLIENNLDEQAAKILNEYVQLFGYKDIFRYFLVAQLAQKLGFTDENIEKSCYVYTKLIENQKSFENFIKDKSIAIVGNGPSEMGKKQGENIDNHDIVIRFNNYQTSNFEEDYGKKVNVWSRGMGSADVQDKTLDNNYEVSIWATDYSKMPVMYDFLDILYRDLKNDKMLTICLDKNFLNDLKIRSENFFPTTGFNTICYIIEYCKHTNVDLYGFSFLQETEDGYATHYFNDRSEAEAKMKSKPHSFDKESEYLKILYKKIMKEKTNAQTKDFCIV